MPKQRETCTECSIRRQKCDKGLPCGRCVKRGVASRCTRDWSRTHARNLSHSSTPAHEEFDIATRATTELSTIASDIGSDGRLRSFARLGTNVSDQFGNYTANPPQIDGSDSQNNNRRPADPHGERYADRTSSSLQPMSKEVITRIGLLQLELPSTHLIWQLVRFHERCLLWYHGCYHGPTFRAELQLRIDPQTDMIAVGNNLQWSALLFALLAGSLICANDRTLASWKFRRPNIAKQATRWYEASTACLELADYTASHALHAVQAIATLTVSAHTLGFSSKQTVLLGAAVRIAQALGIHRLAPIPSLDTITTDSTAEQMQNLTIRETRRRLWSQLCVQDWFSVPSTESYSINPLFVTSIKPGNRDFITMEAIPDYIPTYVSYGNYLYDIAGLIAGLQEALATSHTALSQYERVMEFDADMRNLATKGRPVYFNVTQQLDPDWQDFVPWARRSLTICFSHKIIMIHRLFLCRSFTNTAFSFTRQTCVAAAKTIINEAKQDNANDGPIIWIDQAFCVAAGIVLALDAKHRCFEEPEYSAHLELVQDCIAYLTRFIHSAISVRGIKLLEFMLSKIMGPLSGEATATPDGRGRVPASLVDVCNHDPGSGRRVTSDLESLGLDHDSEELFPAQTGFTNAFILKEVLGYVDLT